MTIKNDITELAQSLKRRAKSANEFGERLYVKADDILALVEALEKAQKREHRAVKLVKDNDLSWELLFSQCEAARGRIAELEESHAQVIQSRDHYKRMSEEDLKQLAESRTVTVKLPKYHVDDADLFGWGVVVVPLEALKEACADAGVIVEIADDGIKVEAE
ncbi:hypothetical protein RVR16_11330 [Klebsiella michiganensis]|uniref:hypothetical protein n=1 Tax=Klebsiella michiganensis TaxID=1134687 RepID=UPI002927A3DC|nr:hypothetical protein [Klebsiella michiganensis]MDV0360597.1 hypothetical protein [Klebsiella michiganensis]